MRKYIIINGDSTFVLWIIHVNEFESSFQEELYFIEFIIRLSFLDDLLKILESWFPSIRSKFKVYQGKKLRKFCFVMLLP